MVMTRTPMPAPTFSLPAGMTATTQADWQAAVAKVLKGGDPARLRTVTRDGIVLEPLVPSPARTAPLPGWRAPGPWQVIARIDLTDADTARAQIAADLDGGADGVTLVFGSSAWARGFGLPEETDPARLLDGVASGPFTVRIEAGARTTDLCAALARHGISAVAANDPFATALATGAAPETSTAATQADGRVIHDAGGSEAQELAYVLAAAVSSLRAQVAAGATAEMAAGRIGFTLAADVDQFATIAKFRALRLLWALVQEEAGLAPAPARIHGETAWRMMSRLDPHTNILRGAIAAAAAGLGGADSLTVLPFTAPLGLADGFARRIARNTQRVLIDEAHLCRVADAGAGAGAIEAETAALAETAWNLFRDIERAGGLATAMADGSLRRAVLDVARGRMADVARRKVQLTGASEYPNLAGVAPAVLAPAAPLSSPAAGLAACRLTEPFEALRDRAALTRPNAFLATLGSLSETTARAGWTRNLLEAGGIAAPVGDGHVDLDALVAAFRVAGTPLAVIVAADVRHESEAEAAAGALVAAGARILLLAGKPPAELEARLRAAGVSGFLFAGMDAVAALDDLLTRMGA